jgi:hypothetical protein
VSRHLCSISFISFITNLFLRVLITLMSRYLAVNLLFFIFCFLLSSPIVAGGNVREFDSLIQELSSLVFFKKKICQGARM